MLHKPFNPLFFLLTISLSVMLSGCSEDEGCGSISVHGSGATDVGGALLIVGVNSLIYLSCYDDDDDSWNMPEPSQTGIDPVVGDDYSFSQSGCFSVYQYPNSGKKVVRFARDCERYDVIPIVEGGFWNEWGDIDGRHCPTDAYAISGSFVTETRAEGTIKYGFGCDITGEASFVAEIAPSSRKWRVNLNHDNIVEIFYGNGADSAQYAALDLDSSYFRMNYGANSALGTSVILLPSVWEDEVYSQGSPLLLKTWETLGTELILSVSGTISDQAVQGKVRLSPPDQNTLSATVTMEIVNEVGLNNRQRKAFKQVMLSSMRIPEDIRDAQSTYIDSQSFYIPSSEEVIVQPTVGKVFGVKGGTSNWKANAPTIEVRLNQPMQIAGRVTSSNDSNDDKVEFWATTEEIIPAWQYMIIAKPSTAD
jgi:hypothetical protein